MLILALLLAAAPASAQKVTSVEGITEYRLNNGLRVLLFPDPTKENITVNVTYLVGARHEGYGETGMAHLLEHLMFKGTDKHRNIPQELTAHGARPNGTTSFDRTNYFETFQATPQNLAWALDLEADRMVHSHIAKTDLVSEMTVVRNEYESGENNPQSVLLKRVLGAAFTEHNYKHLPIGARSDIENVPIERLQDFYRRFYQPDNAVLTIAGKIDEPKVLAQVTKVFGAIPRPSRKLIPTYTAEPVQDGEREVTLRRVGDVQMAIAAWHVPSGVHKDAAALQLLAFALGDTPAGRLHKALVETQKASGVFGFNWALAEPGVFMVGAEVRQEKSLDEARKIMLETVDGLAKAPVTAEELERARGRALKDIELALNKSDVVGLQLSEWIAKGDWRLFFLHRDRLKEVTLADVQRVAATYLKPSNRTVGSFVPTAKPDRSEVPAAPEALALVKEYRGQAAVAQGEAFDPSPANIESRTHRSVLPVGLKVALLPKKTRGGTVVAVMTLHQGDETSLRGQRAVADLSADMLMRGTTQHTRQELQDALDKLKARVSIGGDAEALHVRIETVRENLAGALRLAAEALRQPSFPADQLEQLRQENLAQIEQQRTEPGAMASRALNRILAPYPPNDVRYVPTLDEETAEYKNATLAQVKAFHDDFMGASHGELAVVGDFDEAQIASLTRELFDGWAAKKPYARVERPFKAVAAAHEKLEAKDKANAVFFGALPLEVRDDDADYPALTLANYMLGGGFLNSRLATRIRQKEGLSYGVGSMLQASAQDRSGLFRASAIHAPQNTDKLEKALLEELQRALKDGFSPQELKDAQAGFLQGRKVGRANDAELAGKLAGYLHLDRTMAWDAAFDEKVTKVAPEQAVEALRKHVDPAKLVVVRAGDFAKAAASAPGTN